MDTTNQSNNDSKTLEEIQNYNYLVLSIYFYLKHNNYNLTAEKLFNEANLKGIFTFPQEVNEGTSLYEKLIKNLFNIFIIILILIQNLLMTLFQIFGIIFGKFLQK